MKVLHVQKVNGLAGSEKHLLILLPQLRERGFRPEILVLVGPEGGADDFIGRMRETGIQAEVMSLRGHADPTAVLRIAHRVRRGGYDAVHTHLLHADLYGRTGSRLAGRPVVSTYHNDDPERLFRGVRQVDAATARLCAGIVCISHSVADFVHKRVGIPRRLLRVIHYGMEPHLAGPQGTLRALLGAPPEIPVVGVVGRLIEQKGHSFLLAAMRRVLDAVPEARLAVLGDGELRPSLQTQAAELEIADRVHFLGYRDDAAALTAQFDVAVIPSLWEGFGLVCLEAMAASRPVVASRVSAIPEIVVDGDTGLLVPPRDPDALAAAIVRLLADPDLARQMGARGRLRMQQFTVDAMVRQTVDFYQNVLPDGARAGAPFDPAAEY